MHPERRVLRAAACLSALTLCLWPSALPAQSDVEWKVDHAAGGVHRDAGVIPAAVTLANPTDRDLDLRLEMPMGSDLIQRSVEMPAGARKSLTLYRFSPGFGADFPVRLLDSDDELIGEHVLVSRAPPSGVSVLAGVVGDHSLGWDSLAQSEDSQFGRFYLKPKTLPAKGIGLGAFDFIVWTNPRLSELRPEQVQAVADWTSAGGHLVLAVDDVWLESSTGALEALTSVRAGSLVPADSLSSLAVAGVAAPAPFDRPLSAAVLDASRGDVWLEEPWGPLAVIEARDLGTVTVLGIDPSARPLAGWPGWPGFWRAWIERIGFVMPTGGQEITSTLQSSAFALLTEEESGVELPSFGFLLTAFLVYLLFVGPIEYFVLRRLDRLTWTWFTFPAVVLLVTAGAYLAAGSTRLARPSVQHIVLRDVLPHADSVTERLYASLFATRQGDYTISAVERASLPARFATGSEHGQQTLQNLLNRYRTTTSEQGLGEVRGRVPKWAFLAAEFVAGVPRRGRQVEARLDLRQRELSGSIVAHLGVDLERAWIVTGSGRPRVFPVGPLEDGVEVSLDRVAPAPSADPNDPAFVRRLIPSMSRARTKGDFALGGDPNEPGKWARLFGSGAGVLVGWARDDVPRVAVAGLEPTHAGIVIYRVPLPSEVFVR